MRNLFDEQLEDLHRRMISMGSMCEHAIAMSSKALGEGDIKLAKSVPEITAEIDEKEREIENLCMKLLLRQQPIATDLRVVSSALKMVTDMERIGDNSGDIAEVVSMGNIFRNSDALKIGEMARAVIKMVTESIDAFVRRDLILADEVIEYDDVVDGCFNEMKTRLIEYLKSPDADGEYALDLLMIAKYFERIGDHAVNIAKWVLFSITGEMS